VQAGMYASNFSSVLVPHKKADGSYELGLPFSPETLMPVIDMASDYGLFVRRAIESPAFGASSEILACGELLPVGDTFKQLSESMLKANLSNFPSTTDYNVVFRQLSDKEYLAAMPEMIPDRIKVEILDQMKYVEEFGCACSFSRVCSMLIIEMSFPDYNGKSVIPSQQQLARKPRTWAEFAKASDWSKVLA
jgi:hypothetical protein